MFTHYHTLDFLDENLLVCHTNSKFLLCTSKKRKFFNWNKEKDKIKTAREFSENKFSSRE